MSMLATLSGCRGTIDGARSENDSPPFVLEEYFSGPLKAWGIIQDRNGNIITRFDVAMVGSWDGDQGVLDEKFTYYDGKTQTRQWRITKLADGSYAGEADDIVGKASGRAHGNAMYWSYTMDVPVDDTSYRLRFDDWIWAMHDGVVINRSYMKKFGITFAELTIVMQRQGDG